MTKTATKNEHLRLLATQIENIVDDDVA